MNDSEFHHIPTLCGWHRRTTDDWDGDSDIDCEINDGVLTLSFGTAVRSLLLTVREPLHRVWLATKRGVSTDHERRRVDFAIAAAKPSGELLEQAA